MSSHVAHQFEWSYSKCQFSYYFIGKQSGTYLILVHQSLNYLSTFIHHIVLSCCICLSVLHHTSLTINFTFFCCIKICTNIFLKFDNAIYLYTMLLSCCYSTSVVQWFACLTTNLLTRVRSRTRIIVAQLTQLFIFPIGLVD